MEYSVGAKYKQCTLSVKKTNNIFLHNFAKCSQNLKISIFGFIIEFARNVLSSTNVEYVIKLPSAESLCKCCISLG